MIWMSDERISGALIDFMGYLTTHPEPITVGASAEVYDVHEALKSWADLRGLDLTRADVETWNETGDTET